MGKGKCASAGVPPKHGACEEAQAGVQHGAVTRLCHVLPREELQLCTSATLNVPKTLCHGQSLGDSEGCPRSEGELRWGRACAITATFGHLAL